MQDELSMQTDTIETITEGELRTCSFCLRGHLVQRSLREPRVPRRHFVACGEVGISLVGLDGAAVPERLLVAYR